MGRIAFYGGSFDPPHVGHLAVGRGLLEMFSLDEFVFIPAFHAPHKRYSRPVSAFHRFAMLALASEGDAKLKISTIEVEAPERPYSIETLSALKAGHPDDEIFFVIGADSWEEITTWKRWEEVLTAVNIIVVTRPGFEIGFDHVTEEIRKRVIDLRGQETGDRRQETILQASRDTRSSPAIFISDAVFVDASATLIRRSIRAGRDDWKSLVNDPVRNYILKHGLYLD